MEALRDLKNVVVTSAKNFTDQSCSSIVAKVFMAVGFFSIVILAIYIMSKTLKNDTASSTVLSRYDEDYMINTAGQCPDYWIKVGTNSAGQNICKNQFGVTVNNTSATCYTGSSSDMTALFTPLTKWPMDSTDTALTERCAWASACGPTSTIKASWEGVNDACVTVPSYL